MNRLAEVKSAAAVGLKVSTSARGAISRQVPHTI